MDAALAFGHGHTLHAVHARLIFELAVRALALDREDHFLVAAHIAFALAEQLDLVVVDFGPTRVHTEEFTGKERSLFAARTGPNLHDHVFVVVGVLGNQQGLEPGLQAGVFLLQLRQLQLRQLLHVGVAVVRGEHPVVGDLLFYALETAEGLDEFL
jgi:hypothetical protein